MNIIALISAIIGLTLLIVVVMLCNKVKNRWLRYLSIIVGIVVVFGVIGFIPQLFGDNKFSTSEKTGEYLLYLGVLLVIVKSIFFRKKKGRCHMKNLISILCSGLIVFTPMAVWSSEYTGQLMSLNLTDAKTESILAIISKFSGKGLMLPDSNLGKMSIYVKNTPWDEILNGISKSKKFNYEVSESLIIISTTGCN